jgi:hypothetical protein
LKRKKIKKIMKLFWLKKNRKYCIEKVIELISRQQFFVSQCLCTINPSSVSRNRNLCVILLWNYIILKLLSKTQEHKSFHIHMEWIKSFNMVSLCFWKKRILFYFSNSMTTRQTENLKEVFQAFEGKNVHGACKNCYLLTHLA